MAGANLALERPLPAFGLDSRTALSERTTLIGNLFLIRDIFQGVIAGLFKQLGVRMGRIIINFLGRAVFHDFSVVHDVPELGDFFKQTQIMGNK